MDIDQQPGEYLWYDLQDAGALNIRLLHIHFDHFVDNIIDPKDALERRLCEASNHDPTRTQPLHEYAYLNDQPQLPFEYNASNLMEQDAVYRIYTFGLPVGNGGAFGSPMVSNNRPVDIAFAGLFLLCLNLAVCSNRKPQMLVAGIKTPFVKSGSYPGYGWIARAWHIKVLPMFKVKYILP